MLTTQIAFGRKHFTVLAADHIILPNKKVISHFYHLLIVWLGITAHFTTIRSMITHNSSTRFSHHYNWHFLNLVNTTRKPNRRETFSPQWHSPHDKYHICWPAHWLIICSRNTAVGSHSRFCWVLNKDCMYFYTNQVFVLTTSMWNWKA